MRFTRRFATLMTGGVTVAAGLAATGVTAPAASAGLLIPGLVSGRASDMTPSVPGGQCYPSADQNKCRRVLVIKQIGGWIYAGGIISSVTDRVTGVTTSGFHNIFRFSATTFQVNTSWRPQFYSSAQANSTTAYLDSAVTGITSDGAGTLYVAGSFSTFAPAPGRPASPAGGSRPSAPAPPPSSRSTPRSAPAGAAASSTTPSS